MFVWLETTPIAQWVALSLWAYPALLSLHIIGLAIVVGIFSMRDLRLLGITKGIEPSVFYFAGQTGMDRLYEQCTLGDHSFHFTGNDIYHEYTVPSKNQLYFCEHGVGHYHSGSAK